MGSATHFVYWSGPSGYSETRCWCYASSDHVVGKEQLRKTARTHWATFIKTHGSDELEQGNG